jgi:uncharacterized membrane protein YhaH (DUF805 family)
MNNMLSNFMGFNGRINRQKWWISIIILAIVGFILSWILGLIFGTGMTLTAASLTDPAALTAYVQKAAWVGVITSIVLAYPYLAISIKRRHDRNNNGYDVMGLIALGIIFNLLTALGVLSSMSGIGQIIGVILGIYALYALVVLGFLKGTPGANQYGPDPLGG